MAFKLIVQNSKIVLKSVANYIINASGIKDLLTGTSNVDTNGKIDWTLQHYADTAANFTSANPTLLVGQIGIETDNLLTTPKFKIGDGANDWNTLPYANSTSGGTWGSITGTLSNQTDLQTALNAKEDTANKSTNVNTDQASNTKYPSVKAVYDWATGLFVKKGTLTANTIPKATASDTIGDSSITDNGTIVSINSNLSIDGGDMGFAANKGINSQVQMKGTNDLNWKGYYPNPLTTPTASQQASHIKLYDDGTNFFGIGLNTSATIDGVTPLSSLNIASNQSGYGVISMFTNGLRRLLIKDNGDVKIYQNLNLDNLTASQTVETDSNKNLITAAKGTAYNKDFGTGTTNIPEIGSTLGNTKPLITSSAGKLQTSDWVNIVSSCTFVGWSSYTTQEVDVIDMGVYYMLHINVSGTSNSATTTIQLPYTSLSTNNGAGLFANNGTTIIGRWIFNSGSNIITFGVSATSSVWTATGTKSLGIDIFFKK